MNIFADWTHGHGAGSSLPLPILMLSGVSTLVAVAVSGMSVWLQLRNYRKPLLQRMVVRIMVMVPLYAVASLISLLSLEAAFFIDVVRDIYEAFVIYCFFVLLLDYLGGERSLLIMLHGRPPIPAVFPVNIWRHEIDVSDPYAFLFLKRGIMQYVQVKPMLALASLIMKATGTYNEGDFRARSGYLYVSIIYNISICLALWCLAVFWMCVNSDLKPFRPVPKFLCVKGILFFSFWQSIIISSLVALGIITRLGPYTDREHISLGLTDTLICFEMPFFAAAHMYAFSYRDFTQPPSSVSKDGVHVTYVARMRLGYAFRDAFGLKDLVEDMRATLRGEGINYRAFEPSEGGIHIGAAREYRIRAGLRYSAGGKRKYWLPEVRGLDESRGHGDNAVAAPLIVDEADYVVHYAPDMQGGPSAPSPTPGGDVDGADDDVRMLRFSDALADPNGADEMLYDHAKNYLFGDYLYPVVDVGLEEARRAMWEEEARVARESINTMSGMNQNIPPSKGVRSTSYGATQNEPRVAVGYEDAEQRVVDFGDGEPVSVSGGVKLGWTKARTESRSPAPFLPAPSTPSGGSSLLGNPSGSSSISSSFKSASRMGSLPAGRGSGTHPQATLPGLSSLPKSRSAVVYQHNSPRIPLDTNDAVDLIIPVTDSRHAPSPARTARFSYSPTLIKLQDQDEETAPNVVEPQGHSPPDDYRHAAVKNSVDTVPRENVDGPKIGDIVRAQTLPPYAQTDGYQVGNPFEVDNNPWA